MSDRQVTILSTSSLPSDILKNIPDSINVTVIPFIEIVPRSDKKVIALIRNYGSEKLNVIFTSAHAVKFVSKWLTQKPDWTIYCIRNETKNTVRTCFGSDIKCQFEPNALSLSKRMISDGIQKALFFCGDQRLDILPDNLRNHHIDLNELIVYDTKLIPVQLKESPDIILFFSPTAVKSFFSMNKISSGTIVIAMGTTTATALKEFTEHPVVISPEADKTYVLNMALNYAASHLIH